MNSDDAETITQIGEREVVRLWRDPRILAGCITDRLEQLDVPAPDAEPETEAESFATELLDAGFNFEDASKAKNVFERLLDEATRRIQADAVREMLVVMSKTKFGKTPEFLAFMYLFDDRSMEEFAREAGCSKQALHYHVEKLRPLFDGALT
jgi:hypothetical protein